MAGCAGCGAIRALKYSRSNPTPRGCIQRLNGHAGSGAYSKPENEVNLAYKVVGLCDEIERLRALVEQEPPANETDNCTCGHRRYHHEPACSVPACKCSGFVQAEPSAPERISGLSRELARVGPLLSDGLLRVKLPDVFFAFDFCQLRCLLQRPLLREALQRFLQARLRAHPSAAAEESKPRH